MLCDALRKSYKRYDALKRNGHRTQAVRCWLSPGSLLAGDHLGRKFCTRRAGQPLSFSTGRMQPLSKDDENRIIDNNLVDEFDKLAATPGYVLKPLSFERVSIVLYFLIFQAARMLY